MRDFFSTKKFKVLLCVAVMLAGIMTYAAANNRLSAAPTELLSAVMVPIKRISSAFSNGLEGLVTKYAALDSVMEENQQLKDEMKLMREKMIDYDKFKSENDQFKATYKIKEDNPSFEFVSAAVIGRDPANKFYSFTIDKGEKDGVKVADAVVSSNGVVGKVLEVGPNYSVIATILDPSVNIGSMVSTTRDNGILTGEAQLSQQGLCTLTLLPRETLALQGDIVITTGLGGIFPSGLDIGTIEDILPESSGTTMYAVIKPTVDVATVKHVFIISSFEQ